MGAEQPACPECTTAVRPDWDWCHNCGFDPEGLKPRGWYPGAVVADTMTMTAPAPSRTRRRRLRRSGPAEPPAPPVARVEPVADLRPAAPVLDLTGSVPTTRPAPAPAATARPNPPAPTSPVAPTSSPAVRPTPPKAAATGTAGAAGEQVFPAPKVAMVQGLSVALIALAAFLAFWSVPAVVGIAGGGSVLHVASNIFFILVCLTVAGAMVAQARALLTMRVVVTPTELVSHGRSIRVQRVPLDHIYAVRMGHRPMSALLGEPETVEVPYVQRSDGSGFWLDALGGLSAERPPTAEQRARFDQVCALVSRR